MKGDKYLSIALSINLSVTLSYIFGNVVKILTGRKFDILFLLELPLSSETMDRLKKCLLINCYLLQLTKVYTKHFLPFLQV